MKYLPTLTLTLTLLTQALANTATQPATRPDYPPEMQEKWLKRHEEFSAIARQGGIDVLFIGDSITDYWRTKGKALWDTHFAPLKAANFGISGDRIQQVLWRMENGELNGIKPKVVVVMIGTNNTTPGFGGEKSLTPRNSIPEIIAGVTAVVQTLRTKLPDAKVLLFGIFPRGQKGDPIRAELNEINAGLSRLDDGRYVKFLDIGPKFLAADGTLSRDMMPDLLHPTEVGYRIWAEAIQAPLADFLR